MLGNSIANRIRIALNSFGVDITRYDKNELSDRDRQIIKTVSDYTMTSVARVSAVINAVRYIVKYRIPGDIVECGVWRGGSMMAAALTLLAENDRSRHFYLFDTFAGMPPPSDLDRSPTGKLAAQVLRETPAQTGAWCYATLEDVQHNMTSTGYPAAQIHYIKGRVEETLPHAGLQNIGLLRLDTDWYESTLCELVHLYPLVSVNGVLLLDDYGYWQGARQAVDEYFTQHNKAPVFLHKLDFTGRMVIKTT
jgi:O-methyltransferase